MSNMPEVKLGVVAVSVIVSLKVFLSAEDRI